MLSAIHYKDVVQRYIVGWQAGLPDFVDAYTFHDGVVRSRTTHVQAMQGLTN